MIRLTNIGIGAGSDHTDLDVDESAIVSLAADPVEESRTVVTLSTGTSYLVSESVEQIESLIKANIKALMNRKLGKLAPKRNIRTLRLARYLHSNAPVVPAFEDWSADFKAWTMDGNDTIGDCTCAAIAHMVSLWTAFQGSMVKPTKDQTVAVYSAVTGYDPITGANDNGAAITDVLNYWRTVGIAGHKIDGWAQVDNTNLPEVKQAIYLFGGIDIGLQVPQSAMDQNANGEEWSVVHNDGGIVGGHSIPAFDFNRSYGRGATWGMNQAFEWHFWMKYVDECYAPISMDWLNSKGISPSHLNLNQLWADLKSLPA